MKTKLIPTLILVSTCLSLPAFAIGGSDGGTNVDADTKEPVEFTRDRDLVKIDPEKFEKIFRDLKPRLAAIEDRIPELGKHLAETLKSKPWYFTTRKFAPRTSTEQTPIFQDQSGVYINADEFRAMTREQRKRAWFHELVRGFAMVSIGRVGDLDIEDVTVLLYREYNLPSDALLEKLGQAIPFFWPDHHGPGPYASKATIRKAILKSGVIPFYEKACNGSLKKLPRRYGSKKWLKLAKPLSEMIAKMAVGETVLVYDTGVSQLDASRILKLDSLRQQEPQDILDMYIPEDHDAAYSFVNKVAVPFCKELRGKIETFRRFTSPDLQVPKQEGDNEEANTVEEAIDLLDANNRSSSSISQGKESTDSSKRLSSTLAVEEAQSSTASSAN